MSDMLVIPTAEEIASIAQDLKKMLVEEGAQQQQVDSAKILAHLVNYQSKLNSVEKFVQQTVESSRKSALEQLKIIHDSKKDIDVYNMAKMEYERARKQMVLDLQESNALQLTSAVFKTGYQIINRLREYITNSKIKYHVAIEGKGNKSIIYEISEEHLMKYLEHDTYRFTQALIKSDQELDFNMRYRASKKRSKESTNVTELLKSLPDTGERSTLWSKGYAVFSAVRKWAIENKEISQGFGINFGHFLEAYYDMSNGNKNNHTPVGYTNLKFLETMLSLQNSVEFYRGGDYFDIQLKSNTSTLTNIKTIRSAINDIINILRTDSNTYKQQLQAYFTQDREIEEGISQARIEVPEDLVNIINNLGN